MNRMPTIRLQPGEGIGFVKPKEGEPYGHEVTIEHFSVSPLRRRDQQIIK